MSDSWIRGNLGKILNPQYAAPNVRVAGREVARAINNGNYSGFVFRITKGGSITIKKVK